MKPLEERPVNAIIRILIADGYPFFRLGMRSFLEKRSDFVVVGEADHADDVLQLCNTLSPDILLLDLSLPGSNDTALIDSLRARYPKLKLVVFFPVDDHERPAACVMSGVNGYILRNADPDLTLKAMHSVIVGDCWLQREITGTVLNGVFGAKLSKSTGLQINLSKRETEVIRFLAQGMHNQEIAEQLFISASTVKVHVANIFNKMGVRDRVEAVRYAIRSGVVSV